MKKISVPERGARALFGVHDENLKSLEKTLGVRIVSRGEELLVEGDAEQVEKLENIFDQLSGLAADGHRLTAGDLRIALRLIRHPLLVLEAGLQPEDVVPNDLALPEGVQGLVISGPNAGGKTIVAKAVGLAALAVRAGLHVPCAR